MSRVSGRPRRACLRAPAGEAVAPAHSVGRTCGPELRRPGGGSKSAAAADSPCPVSRLAPESAGGAWGTGAEPRVGRGPVAERGERRRKGGDRGNPPSPP
ncbi:hypothetical protein NDU88_002045 [Pleurodeles waltl]|uniref:Uncharacterized protein n=1 Tax=Pleurodeles waltl TaxID=8319 RepID=A0AAV7P8C5_PLEWA|nr:hypothetical protein NDU88_002045 [Pleurodeles waltl]